MKNKREKLLKENLDRIIIDLKEKYNPQKVILFGSYASGKIRNFSDLDLLVIKDTKSKFFDSAVDRSWLWDIPNAQNVGGSRFTDPSPQVKFDSNGDKLTNLTVTDSDGYQCGASKTVRVRLPLPGWKEIAP